MPTAMAQGVAGKVRVVAIGHNSVPGIVKWQDEYKKKFNDDWYTLQTYNAIAMLSEGMAKAKSVDPVKVAQAMSGLKFAGFGGDERLPFRLQLASRLLDQFAVGLQNHLAGLGQIDDLPVAIGAKRGIVDL